MDRKKRQLYRAAELALLVALAVGVVLALQARAGSAWPATTRSQKPLAAYPPPPAYPPPAAYPPPEGPGMQPTVSPTTPAATAAPRPTPRPTRDVSAAPTLLPVTLTPITFSLTSTDDWNVYTNGRFGFSVKYPLRSPAINTDKTGRLASFVFGIPTEPYTNQPGYGGSWATIMLDVIPNPEKVSLTEFVVYWKEKYKGPDNLVLLGGDTKAKSYLKRLAAIGAEEAQVYTRPNDGRQWVFAAYKGHVYIFSEGFMTMDADQSRLFALFLSTFQFVDE